MRGEPLKHPRKVGRHVAAILDFLAEHGATEIRAFKTKHVIIEFTLGKHHLEVRTACTPRDEHHAVQFALCDLRRTIEPVLLRQLVGAA